MLKKNEEFLIDITGNGSEGEGVGRVDGLAVFVPGAIAGEKVRVRIVKVQKSYAFGKLMEVITPSPSRVEPTCAHFGKCGGCALWHMDYAAELDFKQKKVQDALKRIGNVEIEVEKTVPSPQMTEYRNKSQFPVSAEGIGFFAPRSHKVIDIESCMIQNRLTDQVTKIVRDFMREYKISPYNEETKKGDIRHIFTRTAKNTGQVMVCIVTKNNVMSKADILVERLKDIDGITSIVQNINKKDTNVILGDKNILLWGEERITETLNGLKFTISPHSFFQINTLQTEQLYAKAIELANLTGQETVYDLYCGIGTISLSVAGKAKKVIGVEIVPEAVKDAIENAKANNIDNAEFYVGKAEEVVPKLIQKEKADVVILDPPRKGCDQALIETILEIKPKKVVYISCNPATLARDLALLQGYEVKKAIPFDMFPKTPHVECVVLMSRVE